MRNYLHPLTKLRLGSAALLIAFGGLAYAVYLLALNERFIWTMIIGFIDLAGILASLMILYAALFRAKAAGTGFCFAPRSFMARKVITKGDDFCPVFYKAAGIAAAVIVGIFAAVGSIGIFFLLTTLINWLTGVNFWLAGGLLLAVIASAVAARDTKFVETTTAALGLLVLSVGVIILAAAGIRVLLLDGPVVLLHMLLFSVMITTIGAMVYAAFNWKKIKHSFIGRILSPVKDGTCIPMAVCDTE